MGRRRSKRFVLPEQQEAFLAKAGEWRQACLDMRSRAPIGEPFYDAIGKVVEAIDDVAEAVTGDRRHFWTRPHSAPGPSQAAAPDTAEDESLAEDEAFGRGGGE